MDKLNNENGGNKAVKICNNCSHIIEGRNIPEICPICGGKMLLKN